MQNECASPGQIPTLYKFSLAYLPSHLGHVSGIKQAAHWQAACKASDGHLRLSLTEEAGAGYFPPRALGMLALDPSWGWRKGTLSLNQNTLFAASAPFSEQKVFVHVGTKSRC
jgi:hypothetical protein